MNIYFQNSDTINAKYFNDPDEAGFTDVLF